MRKRQQWFISFTTRLSSLLPFFRMPQTHGCVARERNGRERPTASKNGYKKTGSAGRGHNCKVWALARAPGLPELRENRSGSGPWLTLDIRQFREQIEDSPTDDFCLGWWTPQPGREGVHSEKLVSSGFGEEKRVLFTLQFLCWSTPRADAPQWEVAVEHTDHAQPGSPWGSRNTCKTAGEDSRWMNVNFSQCFLQPLTSAQGHHLPPLSHKRFMVSWACRSLKGRWANYIPQPFWDQSTSNFPIANQWIELLLL